MEKKFVFFIGTLMQGGAERVISILTHHMVEQGYNVEILLLREREIFYDIDNRVTITSVEKECGSTNLLRNTFWIRRFFKKNADIVVSFLAPFNILALIAHTGLKSKIVVADRNDPRYVPNKFLIRKLRDILYVFADGVVLQTTQNKNYFSNRIQKKSVIISNPIDLGEKAGQALSSPKNKEIVSVGRLMPQKNQALLLEAFASLNNSFHEYQLIIFGEGPERKRLEQLAVELGIEDRVFLPGSEKNIFDKISTSEIFVLSSNYEGMPNALIEALCLGLPCITTRVSGAEDLIDKGINGEIVEIGDKAALKQALEDLLYDSRKRQKYGEASVMLNDKLSVSKIMNQWIEYFASL